MKPRAYEEGYLSHEAGIKREENPYTYLGKKNRGNEVWWFTGWDDAYIDKEENNVQQSPL